jgi:hypothetical protein
MAAMELHPYDNQERRFRHTDRDRGDGIQIVTHVLHLPTSPPADLRYDLSFYSGGIGIIDRLAIALPLDSTIARIALAGLHCKSLDEASSDPSWQDDLGWLIDDEDNPLPVRLATVQFINKERKEFQPACRASSPIWVTAESGVNSWTMLWESDDVLSYLSYDQG